MPHSPARGRDFRCQEHHTTRPCTLWPDLVHRSSLSRGARGCHVAFVDHHAMRCTLVVGVIAESGSRRMYSHGPKMK
jgi:hypothetical protein